MCLSDGGHGSRVSLYPCCFLLKSTVYLLGARPRCLMGCRGAGHWSSSDHLAPITKWTSRFDSVPSSFSLKPSSIKHPSGLYCTMARNQEKAQSMLYRFRESQAAELGLANRQRGERRPRMASGVSSLRECERWRGDIMKEVNRKVSKIQDGA